MSSPINKIAREKGLKMVDAKANLVIHLNKRDCAAGEVNSATRCAFALAATRELKATKAYFFRSTAWLEYPDKLVRYTLPASVQKEIVSNDRGALARPGEYQISKPGPKSTMSYHRKRGAGRGRHEPSNTKVSRSVYHRTDDIRTVANTK